MAIVSIIVPIYNVEEYLTDCLDGLVNQTLKDIEIICVDNGSRDGSANVLKEYMAKDSRIKRILFKENQGMPRARNAGFKASTGKYFAFVDSDDICDITMFQKLSEKAETLEADIVTCNVSRFKNSIDESYLHHPMEWYRDSDKVLPITKRPEQFMEQAGWCKLFRRSYINTIDYTFTPGSVCCEDVPCATSAFLHTQKIATVQESLYFYRDREGSVSNAMTKKYSDDFIWAMKKQQEILKENNFNDPLTMSYIVEMKFLMTLHILSKMSESDLPYFFDNIYKVYNVGDADYLKRFFNYFKFSKKKYELIVRKNYHKYLCYRKYWKCYDFIKSLAKRFLHLRYVGSNRQICILGLKFVLHKKKIN